MAALKSYWALTLSLANSAGAKRLYDLAKAVDATVPVQPSKVRVQAPPANDTKTLAVGDVDIGASRWGRLLSKSEIWETPDSPASAAQWTEVYLLCPDNGATVAAHVEIWI